MTHLLCHQDRLYYYIRALEPRRQDADDIVQDTYLVMWEKFDEYREGTSFYAWACKIAYFKILQRRTQSQRGPTLFAPEVLQQLSEEAVVRTDVSEAERELLDRCVDKLPPSDLDLINYRYVREYTREKIAQLLNWSVNTVSKAMSRIRRTLLKCVSEEIDKQDSKRRKK